MNVLYFSNMLLGEQVEKLNASELYAYLMAVALHDVGMTVDETQFEVFSREAGIKPEIDISAAHSRTTVTRNYHNEFSAAFIRKYYPIFDIPDSSYAEAIAQIARGHRKTDLFDESSYPSDFRTEDGSTINLPVLGALIRLADELDMSRDRSLSLLYDIDAQSDFPEDSILKFAKCDAIRGIACEGDTIRITCCPKDNTVRDGVIAYADELQTKLDFCRRVITARSDFLFPYQKVELIVE